jgi:hypothetical protein
MKLLHFSWVSDSLVRKFPLDFSDYLLPAGFSLLHPFYKFPTPIRSDKPNGFLNGKVIYNATDSSMWTTLLDISGASTTKEKHVQYTISEIAMEGSQRGRVVTPEWLVNCLQEQHIVDFEASIIFTPDENASPHSFKHETTNERFSLYDIIRMKDNVVGRIKSFDDSNVTISIIKINGKYVRKFSDNEILYSKKDIKSKIVILSDEKKKLKYVSSDDDIFISTNEWENSWNNTKRADDDYIENERMTIRQASQDY